MKRVKLNLSAFVALRNDPGVVAHLQRMATRANAIGGNNGFITTRSPGARGRTWIRIKADDYDAAIRAREALR